MKIAMIVLCLSGGVALAQPSDAQVKKDLGGAGVLKVTLTSKKGTVQGNLDTMNYEFVRGAEILAKTEYPGIKVIIVGDAVYQRTGKGKFSYWKFRVIENRYEGIPNPEQAEIDKVLDTDRLESFGGGKANTIIRIVKPPKLHEDPQWVWHTPNSVSFRMVGEIEVVGNDTTIDTDSQIVEVRLYRDDLKLPWKTFLATPREKTTLSSRKTSAEELRNTPRLRQRFAEEEAKIAAAKLPKVEIPAFASHEELAMFVHKVLREGPRDRAEAVLRALYSPRNFAPGSTTLLNGNAEQALERALNEAFGAKTSYAQQYCPSPVTENRGAKNRTYFIGVRPNLISEVVSEVAGGGYQDGVKVGERLMLSEVAVRVTDDPDTLAYIASFSDPAKLCAR